MSGTVARRGGRGGTQRFYSEELLEEICDRLAEGESLNAICADPSMPRENAVRQWGENAPHIAAKIARARAAGIERMADEILSIGDAKFHGPDGWVDNGAVQAARLACDNRKWLLSKLLPHQYGDKVTAELVGDVDRPIVTRLELVPVTPVLKALKKE